MKLTLPLPDVLFHQFQLDVGSRGGAREYFQMFVTDLIRVQYPTATEVQGPGGRDWGIDTYVGDLEGSIIAWQSKFFLDWTGESQRGQVRESFRELMEQASDKKIKVSAWTLAVATVLPPDEHRWLEGWMSRQRRTYKVKMKAMNASDIRGLLLYTDYAHVRAEYFERRPEAASMPQPLARTTNLAPLADALFVRQLEEAGLRETDSARGAFFAAEALVRSLADQRDPQVTQALEELSEELHYEWERNYNSLSTGPTTDGRITGLVDAVLESAGRAVDPSPLRLRPAHRRGLVHRLVEDARAGWVTHWRSVAASHDHAPASTAVDVILRSQTTEGALTT